MAYDTQDTIAAIASPAGGAARGIVRVSGPGVFNCLAACFAPGDPTAWPSVDQPRRLPGVLRIPGDAQHAAVALPGHLFVWPGTRSYTREPAAEFHTNGSPPLLAAVLDELCRHGARPAEPGEFTLRAFLAGRIDLTQAEAVLGVVDARDRDDLDGALDQLAGGLSRPLHRLREQLLSVLAELEAGLDFADERIEFIGRDELHGRIAEGRGVVAATLAQLGGRDRGGDMPRVVLAGQPNVGKSSLFNALVERFGADATVRSLVSPTPGATRDYVAARLDLGGVACELIDAAGQHAHAADDVQHAAQQAAADQQRRADVRLHCFEAGGSDQFGRERSIDFAEGDLIVATKIDRDANADVNLTNDRRAGGVSPLRDWYATRIGRGLTTPARLNVIRCSSVTGAGLDELADAIRRRIAGLADEGGGAAATAARCAGSLRDAERALAAAAALTRGGGDELLAAEIRTALHAIGEVVGAVCADDVLDRVFSQFCIGK